VDVAQIIFRLVLAHAHDPVGVFKQALMDAEIADRIFDRQAKLLQRPDLRVDDQVFRVAQLLAALEQVERVTGEGVGRADGVDAALAGDDRQPPPHPLEPAQGVGVGQVAGFGDGRLIQSLLVDRRAGQRPLVLHAQPAHRQQLAVLHDDLHFERLAGEDAAVLELAAVRDPAHRSPAPQPGHPHDYQHEAGHRHQGQVAGYAANHKQEHGHAHPAMIEQAAHRVAISNPAAPVQKLLLGLLKVKQGHGSRLPPARARCPQYRPQSPQACARAAASAG